MNNGQHHDVFPAPNPNRISCGFAGGRLERLRSRRHGFAVPTCRGLDQDAAAVRVAEQQTRRAGRARKQVLRAQHLTTHDAEEQMSRLHHADGGRPLQSLDQRVGLRWAPRASDSESGPGSSSRYVRTGDGHMKGNCVGNKHADTKSSWVMFRCLKSNQSVASPFSKTRCA